jgi:hypothetical protein
MCELAEVVGRARPSHREARNAPKGAAVVDREIIAVLLPDAKGVVPVGEVEGDEVVARMTGQMAQVFGGFAGYVEFGAIAAMFSNIDNQSPLVVTGFGDEEHARHVGWVVKAFPSPAGLETW